MKFIFIVWDAIQKLVNFLMNELVDPHPPALNPKILTSVSLFSPSDTIDVTLTRLMSGSQLICKHFPPFLYYECTST